MLTVTGSRLVSALVKQAHSPSAEKTLFLQRSSLHFPFILYLLVTVYLCCVFSTGKSNMRIFSYKYTLETMAVQSVLQFGSICVILCEETDWSTDHSFYPSSLLSAGSLPFGPLFIFVVRRETFERREVKSSTEQGCFCALCPGTLAPSCSPKTYSQKG